MAHHRSSRSPCSLHTPSLLTASRVNKVKDGEQMSKGSETSILWMQTRDTLSPTKGRSLLIVHDVIPDRICFLFVAWYDYGSCRRRTLTQCVFPAQLAPLHRFLYLNHDPNCLELLNCWCFLVLCVKLTTGPAVDLIRNRTMRPDRTWRLPRSLRGRFRGATDKTSLPGAARFFPTSRRKGCFSLFFMFVADKIAGCSVF